MGNKKEIISRINNLDKDNLLVVGNTSLVLHGLKRSCDELETESINNKEEIEQMINEKNAILEVRAGTGGDEAALFAAVLFEMYQRYSQKQGWKFEVIDANENGIGGYKEASAKITGTDVFAKLKFESGAHRVQRVPAPYLCIPK